AITATVTIVKTSSEVVFTSKLAAQQSRINGTAKSNARLMRSFHATIGPMMVPKTQRTPKSASQTMSDVDIGPGFSKSAAESRSDNRIKPVKIKPGASNRSG